jgi:hypothetical protein
MALDRLGPVPGGREADDEPARLEQGLVARAAGAPRPAGAGLEVARIGPDVVRGEPDARAGRLRIGVKGRAVRLVAGHRTAILRGIRLRIEPKIEDAVLGDGAALRSPPLGLLPEAVEVGQRSRGLRHRRADASDDEGERKQEDQDQMGHRAKR